MKINVPKIVTSSCTFVSLLNIFILSIQVCHFSEILQQSSKIFQMVTLSSNQGMLMTLDCFYSQQHQICFFFSSLLQISLRLIIFFAIQSKLRYLNMRLQFQLPSLNFNLKEHLTHYIYC